MVAPPLLASDSHSFVIPSRVIRPLGVTARRPERPPMALNEAAAATQRSHARAH